MPFSDFQGKVLFAHSVIRLSDLTDDKRKDFSLFDCSCTMEF